MNGLTTFESKQFGAVRTIEENGKVYFCGKDIAKALRYCNTQDALRRHIRKEGVVKHDVPTNGGTQQAKFIDEGNLYRLITHSKLPEAEKFESWVFDEVLPSIRKNGAYAAKTQVSPQTPAMRLRSLEVREMNARSRQAKILVRLADMTLNSTYRETLIANAANLAIGQQLLPLPQLKSRTYSAAEIGEKLGISANKVGRLANAHGLKTPEYGDWFADKAKSADKEVQTFRYYPDVVPKLDEIINGDFYYEHT